MEFEELRPDGTPVPPPMTQEQMQESFEPMQFAGSSIVLPDGCYRVYTSDTDYTEVQASSAYEAMQKTDIRSPHRIERFSLNRMKVLTQEILADNATLAAASEEEVTEPSAEPDTKEASAEDGNTSLPTEEDAATRGLEGDEVDALLDGKDE